MPGSLNKSFAHKTQLLPKPSSAINGSQLKGPKNHNQTFSKIFRWRLPDGQTQQPHSVEVAGSFNHWQPVAMTRDAIQGAWQITVQHIPGNRTHHYMYLVDGKPAYDKDCDGLAIPDGPQEAQFALTMSRGQRVFMLFAQTK